VSGAYYASFAPLVADQLPRILEGGGRGLEGSRGFGAAIRQQVGSALGQWGLPALALAVVGLPRRGGGGPAGALAGFWWAGALLAVPALLTPLDVRFLYALTTPVAVAAATGVLALARLGWRGAVLAAVLVAFQVMIAARVVVDALLWRYR
jgi:hypothetical protein